MFTVNLEKELLKENNKYLSLEEERFVDFVKNTLEESEDKDRETLCRAGFSGLLHEAKKAKQKNDLHDLLKKKYGNKLFTISQIKKLCIKYNLRFLPTEHYKGSFPLELPQKINEYEKNYGFEEGGIFSNEEFRRLYPDGYYICAPASAFKLTEKPKDPLLFHKVDKNEDLYVLIYKWGNDLSIFNMVTAFIKSWRYFFATISSVYMIVAFSISCQNQMLDFINIIQLFVGVFLAFYVMKHTTEDNFYRQKWNSPYK